jgi:hypothetical protein
VVPRGGIKQSHIRLKLRHFLHNCFLVYPLMYLAFRTVRQHQKPPVDLTGDDRAII